MTSETGPLKSHTRRNALRILALGGAAGVAWKLGLFGGAKLRPVTRSRILMGTGVHLTVLDGDREAAEAAADATLERMANLEDVLSRHRCESSLSQLNRTGRLDSAPDALLDVLRLAGRISRMGDGAFDVTVQPLLGLYQGKLEQHERLPRPELIERAAGDVDYRAVRIEGDSIVLEGAHRGITLDGIGKGYVVDRGVEVLKQRGFVNVFVEAGGDLLASGCKPDDVPWRVGIRSPREGLAMQARFDARDRAVATSGDYMQPFTPDFRQHHILDPRTGYSSPELASSTVIANDAATADALATLTMVLGPVKGRDLLEQLEGCEAYFVSKEMEVTRTSGFEVI